MRTTAGDVLQENQLSCISPPLVKPTTPPPPQRGKHTCAGVTGVASSVAARAAAGAASGGGASLWKNHTRMAVAGVNREGAGLTVGMAFHSSLNNLRGKADRSFQAGAIVEGCRPRILTQTIVTLTSVAIFTLAVGLDRKPASHVLQHVLA